GRQCQAGHSLTPFDATFTRRPCKCCKQKTYRKGKPFRCNTYKKPGGAPSAALSVNPFPLSLAGACELDLSRSYREDPGPPGTGWVSLPTLSFQHSTFHRSSNAVAQRRSRPCRDCQPPLFRSSPRW